MSPAINWLIRDARPYCAIVLFLACSGCTTIPTAASLPFLKSDEAAVPNESETGTCTVELRGHSRRPETVEVPLSGKSCVQDVLDASRASSKFRNLDVFVLRPTPQASEPVLKLVCRFDRRKRRISWESDYAVMPGDRVVVREDTSEGFDKIMTSLLGPVLGGR